MQDMQTTEPPRRRRHPTIVRGYDKRGVEPLAHDLSHVRYDKRAAFHASSAQELRAEAARDRIKGYVQLAAALEQAADAEDAQAKLFMMIFEKLCKKHMQEELQ